MPKYTSWANRCVLAWTLGVYLPLAAIGVIAGLDEELLPLLIFAVLFIALYLVLLVRQLSANVELRSDGIYQSTVFSSSFVEYEDITGVTTEPWSGDMYMTGTLLRDIRVPVLILKSGGTAPLKRAFGPKRRVDLLLNDISLRVGLKPIATQNARSRRDKDYKHAH